MASEERRRCGFRKVGGTYIEAAAPAHVCGLLPLPLEPCTECEHSLPFNRRMQRIAYGYLHYILGGASPCVRPSQAEGPSVDGCRRCWEAWLAGAPVGGKVLALHGPTENRSRYYRRPPALMWVGERYYPTPASFLEEARRLGVSKRIHWPAPKWWKPGESWLFLAHQKGVTEICPACGRLPYIIEGATSRGQGCDECGERGVVYRPGIIMACQPNRVVRIVTTATSEETKTRLRKEGLEPVAVQAGDPDHE